MTDFDDSKPAPACQQRDLVTEADLDALVAWLRQQVDGGVRVADALAALRAERDEWKAAAEARHANPADFRYWEGRYRGEKARAEAAEARVAELEAAFDEEERKHGITSDGNLWRFWSVKARELTKQYKAECAAKVQAAEARALAAEAEGRA